MDSRGGGGGINLQQCPTPGGTAAFGPEKRLRLTSPAKERPTKEAYQVRDRKWQQRQCSARRNGNVTEKDVIALWRRWRQKGKLAQMARK